MIPDNLALEAKTIAQSNLSTYYIFTRKRSLLIRLLRFNTCLGIIVPALVGGILLSFGDNRFNYLVAGVLGIVQIFLSVLTVVYQWDNRVNEYLDSIKACRKLYEDANNLYLIVSDPEEFTTQLNKIKIEDRVQSDKDEQYVFSEWENRRGNRYSYYIMNERCSGCNQIPKSLKSSECGVCGNYSLKYKLEL